MPTVKILHTADWHFGSAFGALSTEKANMRKTHLWQTLDRMIALAKEEQVDLFLIAGDLFDGESVSISTARTVLEKLQMLGSIPVFIAAGNHDPNTPQSIYQTLPIPENVHIFSAEKTERVDLSPDIHIYGRSFGKRYEENLLDGFSADSEGVSVMVLHGDVGGSGEYNAITSAQIAQSNLSYLALGHIHQRSGIGRSGLTCYAYPGAPEGRGFDECGEMGVYIGDVSEHGASLRFVPLAEHTYRAAEVDVSDCTDEEQIRTKVLAVMGEDRIRHLYKITLKGTDQANFSLSNLSRSLSGEAFFVKIKNETVLPAADISSFGPLAERMREFIASGDALDEIKEMALAFGEMALSGKEVNVLED